MEVLPCSGVQYAGESDCPQRGSGTAFVYQEEPTCPENGDQAKLADGQVIESLHKMQGPELTHMVCQCNGASCGDCQVNEQKEYCGFHDFEEDMINERYITSENALSVVDTIESESPNNGREGGDLSFSEPKWLEGDGSVALWVKVTICVLLSKFRVRLLCENIFYFHFLKYVLILLANKKIRDS